MIKGLIGSVAVLLLASAPYASATSITIDFEEFAYGAYVNDYYNGGQDSLGRSAGPYYGVSFSGVIRNTPRGAYLARDGYGRTTGISINPDAIRSILGTDQYYISFNAGRYDIDGGNMTVQFENGYTDYYWINGNGNPFCGYMPGACDNPYMGTMGGYSVHGWDTTNQVTSIGFAADRIDNVTISSTPIPAGHIVGHYETDRDIPEPASLALLGVGAAALLARRRHRKTAP